MSSDTAFVDEIAKRLKAVGDLNADKKPAGLASGAALAEEDVKGRAIRLGMKLLENLVGLSEMKLRQTMADMELRHFEKTLDIAIDLAAVDGSYDWTEDNDCKGDRFETVANDAAMFMDKVRARLS